MEQELHALLKDFVKEFQNHKAEFTADPKLVHIYRRGTFASAGQPRYAGSHTLNHATAGMQQNLNDLRQFNNHNVQLSLARAKDEQDRAQVRELYGLN